MTSETSSSSLDEETSIVVFVADKQAGSGGAADKLGKHRILAELNRLHQDSTFLQEELEELEKTDNVSTTCMELLQSMESKPDPLLPEIHGPVNPLWDRWFEGAQDPACRCWIL